MIAPLLALAVLAQPGPRPSDLAFAHASAQCVAALSGANYLEAYLPANLADCLRSLGCEHAACRRVAQARLRALPPGRRAGVLAWGELSGDEQVRLTAEVMLAELACEECFGTGRCSNCSGWTPTYRRLMSSLGCWRCEGRGRCPACVGSGMGRSGTPMEP